MLLLNFILRMLGLPLITNFNVMARPATRKWCVECGEEFWAPEGDYPACLGLYCDDCLHIVLPVTIQLPETTVAPTQSLH